MNALTLISIFLFLIYFQAGLYVLSRSVSTRLNQWFFLLSFSFAVWSFGYIFVYSATEPQTARIWDTVASFGYCMFPAFMVAFKIRLCNCYEYRKEVKIIIIALILWGAYFFAANLTGDWQSAQIYKANGYWRFVHDVNVFYYPLFYTYLLVCTLITFFFLIRWRMITKDHLDKLQFNLYFYPLLIFLVLGTVVDVIFPMIRHDNVPNMGHISSLPWIAGITYAMIRYQLMGTNINVMVSDQIIRQVREVILFLDNSNHIIRTNQYTEKLLGLGERGSTLEGREIHHFFENKVLLNGYLKRTQQKEQLGPMVLTLIDSAQNQIETSLYFKSIKDRFNDVKGYIIYGHDNREAINLQKEILVRQHAEKNLRAISEVLETRVKERTAELTKSYKELQVKMTERVKVEEQIKADIAEKEVLINEIHNRVKNNMDIIISLINANDKENLTPAASKKFKELARRVKSLLLVHNHLYLSISYSDVDFSGFIKILSEELLVFYRRKDKVEIKLDVSDVFLDVDYAIPMALITNELISNSLQHAFSDYYIKKHKDKKHMLNVRYTAENNNYELSIADNGKGLPAGFDISSLSTNGLPLTEILVNDQINGKLEVFSSSDGTMFKITFYANK